ncbi:hypothetical protein ALT721_2120022 [Alteromonas alvinellae]
MMRSLPPNVRKVAVVWAHILCITWLPSHFKAISKLTATPATACITLSGFLRKRTLSSPIYFQSVKRAVGALFRASYSIASQVFRWYACALFLSRECLHYVV